MSTEPQGELQQSMERLGGLAADGFPSRFLDAYGYSHARRPNTRGTGGGQGIVFRTQSPDIAVKLELVNGRPVMDPGRNRKYEELRLLPIPEGLHITLPKAVLAELSGYVMTLLEDMESFTDAFEEASAPEDFRTPWLDELRQMDDGQLTGMIRDFADYIYTGGRRRRLEAYFKCACLLAQLHAGGLVYCDVSPNNVFLSADRERAGEVWLIDADNLNWQSETARRPGCYSPGMGAPEIVRGESGCSFYSDCYAFAVSLFWQLTKAHPFAGPRVEETDFAEDSDALRDSGTLPWIWDREDASNHFDTNLGRVDADTEVFSPRLLDCFHRTFSREGRSRLQSRPTMLEWMWTLGAEADASVKCGHCGMDYDGAERRRCPWCDHTGGVLELRSFRGGEDGPALWRCVRELEPGQSLRAPLRLLRGARAAEAAETAFVLTRSGDGLTLEAFHPEWEFCFAGSQRQLYGKVEQVPRSFRLRCVCKTEVIWIGGELREAD